PASLVAAGRSALEREEIMADRSRSPGPCVQDVDTPLPDQATENTDSIFPDQPVGDVNALFPEAPLDTTPVEDFTAQPTADAEDVDGEGVIFPPTDPVVTTGAHGRTEVLGGFEPTSMTADQVAPSALDHQPGDEALAD